MRLRERLGRPVPPLMPALMLTLVLTLVLAGLLPSPPARAADAGDSKPPQASGSRVVMLTPQPVAASQAKAAASAVAADPLLGGVDKVRYLRFKDKDPAKKEERSKTSPSAWWVELIRNLGTGMRVAMWLVGAALFIWVLLRLRDWLRLRGGAPVVASVAPTHVGSLDIRPDSLPASIGAAARELWQRGETRAAASLLYRGALSRLVHVHAVPIRAASTESDCLSLSEPRLAPSAHRFLSQLVGSWQTVAYAGRDLDPLDFEQLCAGFDTHLGEGAAA